MNKKGIASITAVALSGILALLVLPTVETIGSGVMKKNFKRIGCRVKGGSDAVCGPRIEPNPEFIGMIESGDGAKAETVTIEVL